MATTTEYVRGTLDTLLTTELNTLTNNSLAVRATAITLTTSLYVMAEVELVVAFGTAPTANTGCSVWFLREVDGSNYEDASAGSITPARAPDVVFPVRAVTTTQRIIRTAVIPPGPMYPLLKNDGTGQSLATASNTLKLRPASFQQV